MKYYLIIVFIIIVCLFYIYELTDNADIDDNNSLICNHYKFKSDEEYNKRMIEYNKGGYMDKKLSDDINIKWRIISNKKKNKGIQYLIDDLKKHMNKPLKHVNLNNGIHNISVVCMFRFEDDYLDEFLHYYIMHGITHFYLYSNKNGKKTKEILQPYIDKGYVTLIEWNEHPKDVRKIWNDYNKESIQTLAFKDFNNKYKDKTKWIIKVDIDEFIYSKNNVYIKDILNNTDEKYFSIPRIDFGSSYHKIKPKGLIIENYTKSELKPSSVKSIASTKHISNEDKGDPHVFKIN